MLSSSKKFLWILQLEKYFSTSLGCCAIIGLFMKNLVDYLRCQTEIFINNVYGCNSNVKRNGSPWACKAIFQALSPISKVIIMRLIFIPQAIPRKMIEDWIYPYCIDYGNDSINELFQLRILQPVTLYSDFVREDSAQVQMNTFFQHSFLSALSKSTFPWEVSSGDKHDNVEYNCPVDELDAFCFNSWEKALHFLVSGDLNDSIPKSIVRFFEITTLMQRESERMCITSMGYEFMLKDVHEQVSTKRYHLAHPGTFFHFFAQIWEYVLYCLNKASLHREEALLFLFTLSFSIVGKGYSIRTLSESQLLLLQDLCDVSSFHVIYGLLKFPLIFITSSYDCVSSSSWGLFSNPRRTATASTRQRWQSTYL